MISKYLILADFPKRLEFYLAAIGKTIGRNRSVIILVPDLALIKYFSAKLPNSVILHAGLTKTERWLVWDKIRKNKTQIIIGSQSALFAPARDLGLVIIDQVENETYKNDRSPRFHALEVANELTKLSKANLILGSLTPDIQTYYQATQDKYKIISQKIPRPEIAIVDMNSEKYVISNSLEKAIEGTLIKHQKILLVLNRKGEGTKFSCADCGWIAVCEKCGLPLIPQKADNVCFRCENKYPLMTTCPKCQSVHLKPMGLGTAKLKKFLSDLFPHAGIIQIEKSLEVAATKSKWDIAITTSYGLKFSWPKISLVGIIDADQGLNFPDFNSPQKTFQSLYKFLKIGERGIIQTHLPENNVIKNLARLDYERFFLDELLERKKYGFPPYTHLVRLLFKSDDKEKIRQETQKVFKELSVLITDNSIPITISQPHPAFISKERGKFRYQIILKIDNCTTMGKAFKLKIPNEIKMLLRSLGKGWIVDVDPVNLL